MFNFYKLPTVVLTLIFEYDPTYRYYYYRSVVNTLKYNLEKIVLRKNNNIPEYIPAYLFSHYKFEPYLHLCLRSCINTIKYNLYELKQTRPPQSN